MTFEDGLAALGPRLGWMVRAAARRLGGCRPDEADELWQEARLAVWQAAGRYDPARGPFENYASRCVWGRLRLLHDRRLRARSRKAVRLAPDPDTDEFAAEEVQAYRDWRRARRETAGQERAARLAARVAGRLRGTPRAVADGLLAGERPADVARRLGVTRECVRQACLRAARKTRHLLGEEP